MHLLSRSAEGKYGASDGKTTGIGRKNYWWGGSPGDIEPLIFFSKTPAVIVNLDGDPIWSSVAGTDLKYAINTNWDLFEAATSKTFYLRHGGSWLQSTTLDAGWTAAGTRPESFKKLPADENWNEVRAALPGRKLAANATPKVFVSTKPSELILLTGEPSYLLVDGTSLLWVSNTESDVFRLGETAAVYYLVAGRWFTDLYSVAENVYGMREVPFTMKDLIGPIAVSAMLPFLPVALMAMPLKVIVQALVDLLF